MRVEDRLRHAAAPDAGGAQERARRVVLEAAPAVERPRRRLSLLVALAVLVTGLALTPPGDALARWLRDLVGQPAPAPVATQLGHLPAGGRILAVGPSGAYVIADHDQRHRLGLYSDARWSPHGLFVAVTRGHELRAIEPDGAQRWTLHAAGSVWDPRWSANGYRIAYRRDDDLRVVAGDGSGDRPLVDSVAEVPAAWRPGPINEVAVARLDGDVELWNADSGRRVWARSAGDLRALVWTPSDRLVAVTTDELVVLGGTQGRVLLRRPLARDVVSAALSPDGSRLALTRDRTVSTLRLGERAREHVRLALDAVDSAVWTPDGEALLVTGGNRWYFLPTRGGPVRAAAVRGFTAATGWCCAEG